MTSNPFCIFKFLQHVTPDWEKKISMAMFSQNTDELKTVCVKGTELLWEI